MKTIVIIKFGAHRIPGGVDAIVGPAQCGTDVVKIAKYEALGHIDVTITLDEKDERVARVLGLLAPHGEGDWLDRKDVYTEDELQAAPLLILSPGGHARAWGGPRFGTTYDLSNACPRCGTGARQTSDMIIDNEDVRAIEKLRIAATNYEDILLNDVDVERLLAANVTGALFWPVHTKTKAGNLKELRRQQMFVEHVMPPLATSSLLDRKQVCPICQRGCFTHVAFHPLRLVYHRKDLANIQDVNVTWECFGDYAGSPEEAMKGRWPDPYNLITPKVMNLLRSTKKKDAKYQGAYFIPIWIED